MRTAKQMLEAEERHRKQLADLRESHAKESRALSGPGRRPDRAALSVHARAQRGRAAASPTAEEAGTRKGFSFEERVDEAVERIAAARGDCATHTGAEGAEGGGKKGDVLVELGAAAGPASGRIVFEVKDRKLSKNDAWDGAQRRDGGPRRRRSACSSSPARTGFRRAASSCTSTRATS